VMCACEVVAIAFWPRRVELATGACHDVLRL
jgi:hypothetical protein